MDTDAVFEVVRFTGSDEVKGELFKEGGVREVVGGRIHLGPGFKVR